MTGEREITGINLVLESGKNVMVFSPTSPSRVSMVLMRTVFFECISEERWCSGLVSETQIIMNSGESERDPLM